MRAARALVAALALLVGCADPIEDAGGRAEGSEAPAGDAPEVSWVRADHPELPLSFDTPAHTAMQSARDFSLGALRRKDGRRGSIALFGVRPIERPKFTFHALEIAFFWVTNANEGVTPEALDGLTASIEDAESVRAFLRGVLYAGRDGIELEDRGPELIDGLPARRLGVTAVLAAGTANERRARGEAVVVPVPPGAALIVVARFDERSAPWERQQLFPRILRSLRIGGGDFAPGVPL
jgi:hypothetical protein